MLCKDFLLKHSQLNRGAHTYHCTETIENTDTDRDKHTIDYQWVIEVKSEQQQYIQNIHFPTSFCLGGADILSCACPFMFTPDSIRGPSLGDTMILTPAPRTQGCKVFWREQRTEKTITNQHEYTETRIFIAHRSHRSHRISLIYQRFPWLIFNRTTQTGLDDSIAHHP